MKITKEYIDNCIYDLYIGGMVKKKFLEFEWDVEKENANFRKHGIHFKDAITVFDNPYLTKIDTRSDYKEVRELTLGIIEGKTIILVVHTDRNSKKRIISARMASKKEREVYHEFIK